MKRDLDSWSTGFHQFIQWWANIAELLGVQPPTIARILDTEPDEILVLNPVDLEKFVFDELLQRTKKSNELTPEYILALQHVARVVSQLQTPMEFEKFWVSVVSQRYVVDSMSQLDFQQAWNNAIYGYIHFVWKRNNVLSHNDYIDLAEYCFYRWNESKPQSIGRILANNVRNILSAMWDWKSSMMVRVPWCVTSNL